MTKILSDAELLRSMIAKRDEYRAKYEAMEQAIQAVAPLSTLMVELPSQRREFVSAREAMLTLTEEEPPRDWSAEEVARELEARNMPLDVNDLLNAVRSAMSRSAQRGDLIRTRYGRYKAAKYKHIDMPPNVRPTAEMHPGPPQHISEALDGLPDGDGNIREQQIDATV